MGRIKRDELTAWLKVAIKLGIAATLADVVAELLGLDYPFYAAIAPIIVMGQTRGSTLQAGINRIKGTVIGTLMGACIVVGLGSHPGSILIAVSASVFLCNVLGLAEANRVAGYVAAIVILNHTNQPWQYAAGRFVETSIGIIAAILIDDFLWSPRAAEKLRDTTRQILIDLGGLYRLVFESYSSGEYRSKAIGDLRNRLIETIRRSEKLWQEAIAENHKKLWVDETWEFLLQRTWEHIRTMDYVAESKQPEDTFWQGMQIPLTHLAELTETGFYTLADAVAKHSSHPAMPDLETALLEASQQLDQLQTNLDDRYSPAEMRRFFSFFSSMEEIVKKLKRMSAGL